MPTKFDQPVDWLETEIGYDTDLNTYLRTMAGEIVRFRREGVQVGYIHVYKETEKVRLETAPIHMNSCKFKSWRTQDETILIRLHPTSVSNYVDVVFLTTDNLHLATLQVKEAFPEDLPQQLYDECLSVVARLGGAIQLCKT